MRKPIISTLAILVVSASLAATAPIAVAQQGGKAAATPDKGMTEMKGMMANCNQMMGQMSKMMEGMKNMPMSPPAK